MKRFLLVAAVTVLTVAAFSAASAGGRTYDNGDLTGTYYMVGTQVRMAYLPGGTERVVEYCSGYGTATFDGVSIMATVSTDRCSVEGTTTDTLPKSYEVMPDGTVLVHEAAGYPANDTHCKMVDRGRMLLCDGTLSGPDTLSFHVVLVKE